MMNLNQRSVNVSRTELLTKLRENLVIHEREYAEALVEFKTRLEADLKLALKKVSKEEDPKKLLGFRFHLQAPQDHSNDYREVIEMLEMSVDENINLDSQSFRAYIKNEWHWRHAFLATKSSYGAIGASLVE